MASRFRRAQPGYAAPNWEVEGFEATGNTVLNVRESMYRFAEVTLTPKEVLDLRAALLACLAAITNREVPP